MLVQKVSPLAVLPAIHPDSEPDVLGGHAKFGMPPLVMIVQTLQGAEHRAHGRPDQQQWLCLIDHTRGSGAILTSIEIPTSEQVHRAPR